MIEEKTEVPNSDVRRSLIMLRKKYGYDTPIGRRCSNLDRQLLKGVSPALIEQQMSELRRLLSRHQ